MKQLLLAVLVAMTCTVCGSGAFAEDVRQTTVNGDVDAGEIVPWPWGTECPFPWNKVDGQWKVKGVYGSPYDRHQLTFETAEDVSAGMKLLYINHYNQGGRLVGQGVGYSNRENKIIKAVMTDVSRKADGYQIVVRSYAQVLGTSCRNNNNRAVAATFCPRKSKTCTESQNYLLVK